MKIIGYIIIAIIVLLLVLAVVYFILLFKLKNINNKIYKYKEEKIVKDENILIVYHPSIHKTINNLVNMIKDEVLDRGYGVMIHTLNKDNDDYLKYKATIFVAPVYFGEIHSEFLNKVSKNKIKNLFVIYNGLNKESNNEDNKVNSLSINKYKKIKLHTQDIENVKEFIKKEVI